MESSYFRAEDTNAIRKQLERLVKEGKLPQSALGSHVDAHAPALFNVPTVVRQRLPSETVYQHVKGIFPGGFRRGVRTVRLLNMRLTV
jgi:hypothetical protein